MHQADRLNQRFRIQNYRYNSIIEQLDLSYNDTNTTIDSLTNEEVSDDHKGYRFMDMYILQNVFNILCPECKQNNIQFVELGKQGCARNLMLECQCGWDHSFWSFEKVNNTLTKTEDPTVLRV